MGAAPQGLGVSCSWVYWECHIPSDMGWDQGWTREQHSWEQLGTAVLVLLSLYLTVSL